MKDLSTLFLQYAEQSPYYGEACSIVRENSQGRSWLIGGFIFRTLAMQLYGAPEPESDLDFIVEEMTPALELPEGWQVQENRFGNPKLLGPRFSIDLVPLANVYSILSRGLSPSIENFLSGTPLTVQSLAFDVESHSLQGEAGIEAVLSKTVAVNNMEAAQKYASRYNTTINAKIIEKAEPIGLGQFWFRRSPPNRERELNSPAPCSFHLF